MNEIVTRKEEKEFYNEYNISDENLREGYFDFLILFDKIEKEKDPLRLRTLRSEICTIRLPVPFQLALDAEAHYAFIVATEEAKKNNAPKEYIYAMETDMGLVKIGKTSNPDKRRAQLASCNGSKIVSFFVQEVSDSTAREREAHRKFRARRHLGEYFKIPIEEAVEFIQGLS